MIFKDKRQKTKVKS